MGRTHMGAGHVIRQNTRKNLGTVESVADFGDGLRRIVFSPRARDLRWKPGMAVATIVDPEGKTLKDRWRHYTIRRQHDDGSLEFLLTRHDAGGPGIDWLEGLSPGDSFTFMGPGGSPVLEPDHHAYVLIGDRTSLASMGAMRDALPTDTSVTAIVATPNPDRAQFDSSHPTAIDWIEASDADSISTGLADAVSALGALPSDAQVYLTGEMRSIRAVRTILSEQGIRRRQIGTHAHWTPGRRGM